MAAFQPPTVDADFYLPDERWTTTLSLLNVGEPPCTGCPHHADCKAQELACQDFNVYTYSGTWEGKPSDREPSTRIYSIIYRGEALCEGPDCETVIVYDDRRGGRRFCRTACRSAWARANPAMVSLTCLMPGCVEVFQAKKGSKRKYCSPQHSRRAKWIASINMQNCDAPGCIELFKPRGPKKYCSSRCLYAVTSRRWLNNKVGNKTTCRACSTEFTKTGPSQTLCPRCRYTVHAEKGRENLGRENGSK